MFLGIDPGMRKVGYALIGDGNKIIDAGILLLEKKEEKRSDCFFRIKEIFDFFENLINKHEIKSIGMEKLFFTNRNQAHAEFIYGLRGAIAILALKKNIKLIEISPIELKKYITGNGKAEKILVKQFVSKIFGLQKTPAYADAADALGLAYVASRLK